MIWSSIALSAASSASSIRTRREGALLPRDSRAFATSSGIGGS